MTRKCFFWGVALVQVKQFGTGTRHGLKILLQHSKRVKTKNPKVLWADSYVCRSYSGKTGRKIGTFLPPSWIRLKLFDVLPFFSFQKSETMHNYYLKPWYIQVAEWVAEWLKTWDLWNFGNFWKVSKRYKMIA